MTVETIDEAENTRKDAALALAARGFHVFAVDAQSKRPDRLLAPAGFKDATRDPETVAGWFDVKPRCNLGIACGPAYGTVVLDADVKNGAHGLETLRRLQIGTPTLTANSPTGGLHLYFKHPGVPLPAKLDGIDIKGADGGGYVLAPPSELPSGPYTWCDEEMPVADFPPELLADLRAEKAPKANGHAPGPVASIKVPAGTRHNRLLELGAVYRGKGLQADELDVLLWHHARRYFDPPFDPANPEHVREIEDVVHWFGGKAAEEATTTESLLILTTAELRRRAKIAPTRALLDPPLPEAGSMMIYGATGIGKSHIGVCIAGALALGRPFLDWTVAAPTPVLYVDGEMPLDELETRLKAYYGDEPLENLSWIAARAQESDLPNLADPAAQERYLAAVLAVGAKVAVFDNLSCLRVTSIEAPENSHEAWLPVGQFIRRVNRLGIAVVLIHHANARGTQRGSTAQVAPMDTVLCLRALPEGQPDPQAENDIEFVFEKHRRFGGDAATIFRAQAIGNADGRVIWRRIGADPLVDDVVRLRSAGKSVRDIAHALNRSKAGIQKAIERAKARGMLPLGGDGD